MNCKFFILLLLSFHIASAMEDVALSVLPKTHELKPDYETIRSLAKGSLGAMAIWKGADLLNVTSHELGHAAVGKVLFDKSKMHITIGSCDSHGIIYSGKNFSFSSGLFKPVGYCHGCVNWAIAFCTPVTWVASCAAGPLAGIGSNVALFYAANKLAQKDYDKTADFLKLAAVLQTGRQLSCFYINEIEPLGTDGEHIANSLNFSKNMKKTWNRSIKCAKSGILAGFYMGTIWSTSKLIASMITETKYKDMPGFLEILTEVKKDLLS
jgi:hypothetical protein